MRQLASHWKLLLKVAVSVLLFWLVARSFGSGKTLDLLAAADLTDVFLACLLLAAAFVSNGVRWWLVSHASGHGLSIHATAVGTTEAAFFNQVLPTGIGGDAMRVLRAYDEGVPTGWAVIGVTIDRALGLLAVALSMVGLALWTPGLAFLSDTLSLVFFVSALVVSSAAAAFAIGMLPLGRMLPAWAHAFVSLFTAYCAMMRQPRFLVSAAAAMAASIVLYTMSFVMCARAVGASPAWLHLFIVIQGIALSALIPLSIGGWGVREGAAVALFAPFGVAPEEALAVSVAYGIVLTIVGAAGGLVWLAASYRRLDRQPDTDQ